MNKKKKAQEVMDRMLDRTRCVACNSILPEGYAPDICVQCRSEMLKKQDRYPSPVAWSEKPTKRKEHFDEWRGMGRGRNE